MPPDSPLITAAELIGLVAYLRNMNTIDRGSLKPGDPGRGEPRPQDGALVTGQPDATGEQAAPEELGGLGVVLGRDHLPDGRERVVVEATGLAYKSSSTDPVSDADPRTLMSMYERTLMRSRWCNCSDITSRPPIGSRNINSCR